jgi:hypothetical protein
MIYWHEHYNYLLWIPVLGIAKRLVWKVLKPKPLSERVRYWEGGVIGIWNVRPRIYKGHKSKSRRLLTSSLGVIGCRLCMVPLEGSSRMTLFTMISSSLLHPISVAIFGASSRTTYLGVNQPFLPRDQLAVWQGPAGISMNAKRPMINVMRP